MQNIKLVIAYDGKNYFGWQKGSREATIEEVLQRTLEKILQHPVTLQAASRTDAGVHANQQVVNFFTSKTSLSLFQLKGSLNSLLPKDIIVISVEAMPFAFHPTIDCIGKEYRYYFCAKPLQLPQHRFYSWHVPYPLDFGKIGLALPYFIGNQNFSSFCNVRKSTHYTDYFREVRLLELVELEKERYYFQIFGNHFLYRMVRIMVGTIIGVGLGKITLERLPEIFKSNSRIKAGITAPAHALFLHEVFY